MLTRLYNCLFEDYHLFEKWKHDKTQDSQLQHANSSITSQNPTYIQHSVKSSNFGKKKDKTHTNKSIRVGSNNKKHPVFSSFDKHSNSPFTTHENLDFSISNVKNIINWVCGKYQTQLQNKQFDENILAKIMIDFGYLNSAQPDSKATIQIAKFIEHLTQFVNLITVRNKFRLLIQIFYNFENKQEFKEDDFFEELERLSPQMDSYEHSSIQANIIDVRKIIG